MRHGPHNKHVTGANAAARVVIVVFAGVKLLDAAGPAEVFAEADRFGANYSLRSRRSMGTI